MNRKEIAIYYSSDFGFIITSYAKKKNSIFRYVISPVIKVCKQDSLQILYKGINEALNTSKNAPELEPSEAKDADFWSISGIKNLNNFSKKFRCINITEANDKLSIVEWKRHKSGGYVGDKDDNIIEITIDSSPQQIGQTVLKLLSIEIPIQDDTKQTFETLNNIILYERPSDDFLDLGDGGTDAYQIFKHEDNAESPENYIAFLMPLYSELKEEAIKKRWSQMYEGLLEFDYREVNKGHLLITITGITADKRVISNIYKDNDLYFELMTEINFSNTSTVVQEKIESEFKKVVDSLQMVKN